MFDFSNSKTVHLWTNSTFCKYCVQNNFTT